EVARRARHEQVNDPFCFWRKVRSLRRERIRQRRFTRSKQLLIEQRSQRDSAQPNATFLEKPTARDRVTTFVEKVFWRCHRFLLRDGLVEVQQRARNDRIGGELCRVCSGGQRFRFFVFARCKFIWVNPSIRNSPLLAFEQAQQFRFLIRRRHAPER